LNLFAYTVDLNIFMTVGLQETAFKTDRGVFDFVAMNRETRKTLVERGATSIISSGTATRGGLAERSARRIQVVRRDI